MDLTLDRLLHILLGTVVAALAWGFFAFGAVYPWAYWPLLAVLGVVGVLAAVLARCGQRLGLYRRDPFCGLRRPLWSLAVLVFAISVQLVPVPRAAIEAVSPATSDILRNHDLSFALATDALPRHALSINPQASRRGLAFAVALSIYLIGLAALLSLIGAHTFAVGILIVGFAGAMVAIAAATTSGGRIYGFWNPQFIGDPFGPFVNKNHFAGWMVMAISVGLGYWCWLFTTTRRRIRTRWRDWSFLLSTAHVNRLLATTFVLTVMALSLVMSMSRSGIACMVVALSVFTVVSVPNGRTTRRMIRIAALGAALAVLCVITIAVSGFETISHAMTAASWSSLGGRLGAWRDATSVIRAFPLSGTGLNTYNTAMLSYQTFETELNHFRESHNDYLQLLAEGGLLVGVPAFLCVCVFAHTVRRRFAARCGERPTWLRIGAVVGLGAMALQEVVDFSLQMPGNAALFSSLVAVAIHKAPPAQQRMLGNAAQESLSTGNS